MAKRTTSLRVLRGILCGTGAAVIGVYAGFCVYYHGHYFPHTTIGGISCGNQTADDLEAKNIFRLPEFDPQFVVATGNPTRCVVWGEIMPVVINTKTCIDADDSCTCTAENAAEYPQRGCSFCHKTLLFMRRDLVLNEEPAYTPVHRFDR